MSYSLFVSVWPLAISDLSNQDHVHDGVYLKQG